MNIPIQLKDQLFCRVRYKEKRAFEPNWQKNGYSYSQITKFKGENYGVLCGVNNLAVLDDDTKDKRLIKLFKENFGETFRVRDHYYFRLKGWDKKKMILYGTDGEHLGECQGQNSYVVGPNSTHPTGEIYEIKNNLSIKEIDYLEFIKIFGDFLVKKDKVVRDHVKTKWEGDGITDIPITSIVSLNGFVNRGSYFQGPHPKHGSTGGMNFVINPSTNTWHCFRCKSGGGPAELIAVMEDVIPCSQAGPSCFSKEQGREVINIAREKYGLKSPESKEDSEPLGWANSISIIKMAERYNLKKCPHCQSPLEFKDKFGWWKCSQCNLSGGLKKFAELILQTKGVENDR